MAYEPTVWVDDETPVNAENLNKLEQGVAEIHTAKENGELDGEPGKSAYQYALDGGYTGTEEEFARKLASESSAIHIGSEPPEDENVTVWIDTDEEPAESGGADWNANEGEPGHVLNRTHWVEQGEVVIAPEQTLTPDPDLGMPIISANHKMVADVTYTVKWNGVVYECQSVASDDGAVLLGNFTLFEPSLPDTGEPFGLMYASEIGWIAVSADTSPTVSITILGEVVHTIPSKFLPMFTIETTTGGEPIEDVIMSDSVSWHSSIDIPHACLDILWQGGNVRVKFVEDENNFAFLDVIGWMLNDGIATIFTRSREFTATFDCPTTWTPPTT